MTLYLILFLLLLVTIIDWVVKVVFIKREGYFHRRLRWSRPKKEQVVDDDDDEDKGGAFGDVQLRMLASEFSLDSYFILRLIENNCGSTVAAQIIEFMFHQNQNAFSIADNHYVQN